MRNAAPLCVVIVLIVIMVYFAVTSVPGTNEICQTWRILTSAETITVDAFVKDKDRYWHQVQVEELRPAHWDEVKVCR